jgi:uroporphyrinogen decarboxylase
VPTDLGATPSSGISAIAYGNLKKHLGLAQGSTRVYDVVQQLAQPEDFILDRFRIDAIDIGRAFNTEAAAWQPTVLADGQRAEYPAGFHPEPQADGSFIARMKDGLDIAHMPAGGTFYDQSVFSVSRRLPGRLP